MWSELLSKPWGQIVGHNNNNNKTLSLQMWEGKTYSTSTTGCLISIEQMEREQGVP